MHGRTIGPLYLAASLFVFALAGCNQTTVMQKIVPAQDEAAAKADVDLLRQNNFDQIEKKLDPAAIDADTPNQLAKMASIFPREQPKSIKVVGWHVVAQRNLAGDRSSTMDISLEYEFSHAWVLVGLETQTNGNQTAITTFNANGLSDSLEHANRFTLAGKGAAQYATLLLALLDAGVVLYALVLCLKTRMGKKKWYWPILIALGVGTFSVNWTNGNVAFALFSFHLPPVGAGAQFYSPWTVYACIPAGAIAFLLLRNSLTLPDPVAAPPPPSFAPVAPVPPPPTASHPAE